MTWIKWLLDIPTEHFSITSWERSWVHYYEFPRTGQLRLIAKGRCEDGDIVFIPTSVKPNNIHIQ